MKKIKQSLTRIWNLVKTEVGTWFEHPNPDIQTWTWSIDEQRLALRILQKEGIDRFRPTDFDAVWNGDGREPYWTVGRLIQTIKDYDAATAAFTGLNVLERISIDTDEEGRIWGTVHD